MARAQFPAAERPLPLDAQRTPRTGGFGAHKAPHLESGGFSPRLFLPLRLAPARAGVSSRAESEQQVRWARSYFDGSAAEGRVGAVPEVVRGYEEPPSAFH